MKRLPWRVLVIAILGACLSCAMPPKKPSRPKPPPGSRMPPVTSPSSGTSAQRSASESLIQQGTQAMDQGRYEESTDLFQEAVSVDPSHGAGYYHLALVKFKTGEWEEASNLLEKAETLLAEEAGWTERLEELKRQLHESQPP